METPERIPSPPPAAPLSEPLAPAADPAQESLVSALRSSFAVLRLVILVLLILYAVSGVFPIEPGDQGVIVRLGKPILNMDEGSEYYETPVFGAGWIWWALPDPIDEKIRLPGRNYELETDAFLFSRSEDDIKNDTDIATLRRSSPTLTPGRDGASLTGDKNLSHGLWKVEYRIADAAKFVTEVGEQPGNVEPIAEAPVRERNSARSGLPQGRGSDARPDRQRPRMISPRASKANWTSLTWASAS